MIHVFVHKIQVNTEENRDKEVRVIGADGSQMGVMSAAAALKLAEDANLDLVKIAPTANPPVCRVMDYGKYRFVQAIYVLCDNHMSCHILFGIVCWDQEEARFP